MPAIPKISVSTKDYNNATGENTTEPKYIPGKLCIVVTREPYDDSVTIKLPSGSEEYVFADKAEKLLRLHGVKNPDKVLTHVWNFFEAILYVDDLEYLRKHPDTQ